MLTDIIDKKQHCL